MSGVRDGIDGDVLGLALFPVTPCENRYLRLRDRLRLGPRVDRYLRRHPGLSGGVSIEDDWPREPYRDSRSGAGSR